MGLPVVITPGISDDSDIIKENKIGAILENFNSQGYNKVVSELDRFINCEDKQEIKRSINIIAKKFRSFKIAEDIYAQIYD